MDFSVIADALLKRPELVGAQSSIVMGVTLYFIKKLMGEVRKSIKVNSQIAFQLQTLTERLGQHERSQKENYEELSQRVRKLEISTAVIEREILRKTGHNDRIL